MNILLTGALGYLGEEVYKKLIFSKNEITVTIPTSKPTSSECFSNLNTTPIPFEIGVSDISTLGDLARFDVVIDFAWRHLGDYESSKHAIQSSEHAEFLENFAKAGVKHIIVSGTCQEYGKLEGGATESAPVSPDTAYAKAKVDLHLRLVELSKDFGFSLQWLRIFYLWSIPPKKGTLLGKLHEAIEENKSEFEMSEGHQLRDYVSLYAAAAAIELLSRHPETAGPINISTGQPISVLNFVKKYLDSNGLQIKLKPGIVPIPYYEPLNFWGLPETLTSLGFSFAGRQGELSD